MHVMTKTSSEAGVAPQAQALLRGPMFGRVRRLCTRCSIRGRKRDVSRLILISRSCERADREPRLRSRSEWFTVCSQPSPSSIHSNASVCASLRSALRLRSPPCRAAAARRPQRCADLCTAATTIYLYNSCTPRHRQQVAPEITFMRFSCESERNMKSGPTHARTR